MSITSKRSAYWSDHFNKLAGSDSGNEQIDFSNQALVIQNYSFMLEACGIVAGKRVLDAGFGTGDLARMLAQLGGDVTAFDTVSTRIPKLRQVAPTIAWWHDDISTWKQPRAADPFDLIVACETLQYVEFNSAVHRFLDVLSDQGRLVILIPNADCQIVRRVSERFDRKYVGVSMNTIEDRLRGIADEFYVAYRGIHFQEDQTLVPYQSGQWNRILPGRPKQRPHFSVSESFMTSQKRTVANRLQIVVSRKTQNASTSSVADGEARSTGKAYSGSSTRGNSGS